MEQDEDLLQPYLRDIKVKGRKSKVLHDTGGSYDVVHSSLVNSGDFELLCVPALEERPPRLPVAKVTVKGVFGESKIEAAVSDSVLPPCQYLQSNRTANQLLNAGVTLHMNPVMVVARPMVQATAAHEKPRLFIVSGQDQKLSQSDDIGHPSSDAHDFAHEEGE